MGIRLKNQEEFLIAVHQDGNNTTGQLKLWRAPFAGEIVHIAMGVATAGITGSLIGDVNINTVSVFATAGNKPTLTTGTDVEVEGAAAIDGVKTFVKGDILDFSLDTVHSGTPGIDCVASIVVRQRPSAGVLEFSP